jgi:hypothetical protein
MRWRLAKKILRREGAACPRRWSAYHRIAMRHQWRWWVLVGFAPDAA